MGTAAQLLQWLTAPSPFDPGESTSGVFQVVLGPDRSSYTFTPLENLEETFYVEALEFPSASFSGLISFSISLIEDPPGPVCCPGDRNHRQGAR